MACETSSDGPSPICRLYFSFFKGVCPDHEPLFFDAPNSATPWIYSAALVAVRELWARTPSVTADEVSTCGLHGLRVSGNVGVTRGLGKETAKAQGGWESDAQDWYHRVGYDQVVQIPDAIVASWQAQEADFDVGGINGPVVDPFSPRAARLQGGAGSRPAPHQDPEPVERTLNPGLAGRGPSVPRGSPPALLTQGTPHLGWCSVTSYQLGGLWVGNVRRRARAQSFMLGQVAPNTRLSKAQRQRLS